ncbi:MULTISPECIES: transglycosylase domain-containing protein [unclassified Fusibacter]|uniref:transglycosylase domain-containing protein n=1 Tax=unclassified Fusibacter TaxID=2624464 RepID=UPI001010C74C|nr:MULTISPECIES: transglycosylase domain-containing protein [unclassified Fusibacter]MCK8058531.1 transglycosylase domain-containing protein [Fusibacter sp. A2]NPE22700.1 hypothetical protein [Fusibacter sp. A1]RXV60260.1 hypothetical protein DWB64_12685 [Fusibacter sp. A1]
MSQYTKKNMKKKKLNRLVMFLIYTFFLVIVLGVIAAGTVLQLVQSIIAETPPITNYDIYELLEENSVIYDINGVQFEKVSDGGVRTIIPYEDIDKDIIDAFVAVEDKTFFEHDGFNFVRLVGAVIEALKNDTSPSGTSTITQQYARNMYLADTRFDKGQEGFIRKIKEAHYATDLEEHLSKEQIIASYLNTIELGANVQGIQAATQRYFSKDADDVDYIEAAILAGIPKASSRYAPFTIIDKNDVTDGHYVLGEHADEYAIVFNENMLERFKVVLYAMKTNSVITKEQYDYALDYATSYKIIERFVPGAFRNEDISSYFADMVKEDVLGALIEEKNITKLEAERMLYGAGLQIYSTLDLELQKKVEAAYNSDDFNPTFDAATRRAVVAFQKKYSLGTDGIVGPDTLNKLAELGLIERDKFLKENYWEWMIEDEIVLLKQALEKEGLLFRTVANLPVIEAYRDKSRNILHLIENENDDVIGSIISLNDLDTLVNANAELVVNPNDYYFDNDGNLVLKHSKAFNFYRVFNADGTEKGIDLFIKDAYRSDPTFETRLLGAKEFYDEKVSIQEMYIFKGKTIKIGYEYKSFDRRRNIVIDKSFFEINPTFYTIGESGELLINKVFYNISSTGVIQPQSAMVVIDYRTGELRALVGGRNIAGQRVYNRALNPRQPGSSIKPLGVYIPALDSGLTTSTVFDDVPHYDNKGKRWPKNWYEHQAYKYWGIMTMREAIEMSNNVIAVKVADRLGVDLLIPYLQKFGISTLDLEGPVHDRNLSAVALGGMSVGTTPLDMAGAYGAIANGGTRNETITFTKVTDKYGKVILENVPEKTFVVEENVAFLMHDMLQSGARVGLAKTAAIRENNEGIPIAGKTGTTSSKHDAWFIGYTGYYAASVWIGNDVQVPLSQGSTIAAKFWKGAMQSIHEDLADKGFKSYEEVGLVTMEVDSKSGKIPTPLSYRDPEGSTVITELFIPGTEPTEYDDIHKESIYCSESNRLITPYCPESTYISVVTRTRVDPGYYSFAIKDNIYMAPRYGSATDFDYAAYTNNPNSPYCFIHTGVVRTAQTTVSILGNIGTTDLADGQKLTTESIIITTIHKAVYNVDAGSRINNQGTIVTTENIVIYPWQIESYTRK